MSIKRTVLKLAVGVLRLIYAPMKLRQTKNRITIISRQSNEPSVDIALLSDYLKTNYPDIEVKVMCRRLEKKSAVGYAFHMLSQMMNVASSKVLLVDGYCIVASALNHKPELTIVQMWHSMAAIKAFGYQAVGRENGRSREMAEAMCMHRNYDYVLAPSEVTGKLFAEAFGVSEQKLKYLALPRTDVIMRAAGDAGVAGGTASNGKAAHSKSVISDVAAFRAKVRQEYGVSEGQEILLYAPTFRKNEASGASDVGSAGISGSKDGGFEGAAYGCVSEALEALQGALDDKKFKLIVKLHPLYDEAGVSDKKYSTYEWFQACDRVITDYSAIGVEAAMIGKPLYYYVYDIEDYNRKLGVNVDPRVEIPKATAMTAEELAELIGRPYDFEELERFREKYVSVDTTDCTAKLGDFVYECTGEKF